MTFRQGLRALLPFAFFRAVFDLFPIARPFLTPLKRQATVHTNFRGESIFCDGRPGHRKTIPRNSGHNPHSPTLVR